MLKNMYGYTIELREVDGKVEASIFEVDAYGGAELIGSALEDDAVYATECVLNYID